MIILIDHNYPTEEALFDAHEARLSRLCRELLDITPAKKARDVDHMTIDVTTQIAGEWVNASIGFDVVMHESQTIERGNIFTDSLDDYYGYPSISLLRIAYGNDIQPIDTLTDDELKLEIDV